MTRIITVLLLMLIPILIFAYIQSEKTELKIQTKLVKQDTGMSVKEFIKKVTNNEKLVFVYFNADWCMPCIKLKPVMDQIEIDEKDRMILLRIDVDDNPSIATHFEINALPLFMIYKKGKVVWTQTGMLTKQELERQIHVRSDK